MELTRSSSQRPEPAASSSTAGAEADVCFKRRVDLFFSIKAGGLYVPVTNSLSVARGCHSRSGALKVKSGHTLKSVHCSVFYDKLCVRS